ATRMNANPMDKSNNEFFRVEPYMEAFKCLLVRRIWALTNLAIGKARRQAYHIQSIAPQKKHPGNQEPSHSEKDWCNTILKRTVY
ncbi:hypothetical protein TNCV_3540121, partial [Trichonephila clavipes]